MLLIRNMESYPPPLGLVLEKQMRIKGNNFSKMIGLWVLFIAMTLIKNK